MAWMRPRSTSRSARSPRLVARAVAARGAAARSACTARTSNASRSVHERCAVAPPAARDATRRGEPFTERGRVSELHTRRGRGALAHGAWSRCVRARRARRERPKATRCGALAHAADGRDAPAARPPRRCGVGGRGLERLRRAARRAVRRSGASYNAPVTPR